MTTNNTNAFDRAINNRTSTVTFIDLDVLLEVLDDKDYFAPITTNMLRKVVHQTFANKCNRSVGNTICGYRLEDLLSDCVIELSNNPDYDGVPMFVVRTALMNAHRNFTSSAVLPLNLYVRDTCR